MCWLRVDLDHRKRQFLMLWLGVLVIGLNCRIPRDFFLFMRSWLCIATESEYVWLRNHA